MNTERTIQLVMTTYDRPQLCVEAIRSLNRCSNSHRIKLDIFHDQSPHAIKHVRRFIRNNKFHFNHIKVHEHESRFGWTKNSFTALSFGFDANEYVVLVEDDQLFAIDFIELHEYFRDKYATDENIFSASAGHYLCNKRDHSHELDFNYTKHRFFHNQGWGTWIDRWREMSQNWEKFETFDKHGNTKKNYEHNGWDWKMQNVVQKKRLCAVPFLSRVHNVGVSGAHCGAYEWEKHVKLSHWAGDRIHTSNNVYTYRGVWNPADPDVHYFRT